MATQGKPPQAIDFEVAKQLDGGYTARAIGYSIFTQGEDWDDLKTMVRDAVRCHFDDEIVPPIIHLHCKARE